MNQTAESAAVPSKQGSGSPFADDTSRYSDAESASESELDDVIVEEPKKNRKPIDNNFFQQRLWAVNPVFTARTTIPILVAFAVFLIPLGGAMWLASHRIEDFTIDYTQCELQALRNNWLPIPDEYTKYRFKNKPTVAQAQWRLDTDELIQWPDERNVCRIQFVLPHDLKLPLYFFYRLEGFHQNHRRYVKSYSEDQIKGKRASLHDIKHTQGINCLPLSDVNGTRIYPCGLIANSMFNDTFSTSLTGVNGTTQNYDFTKDDIAWGSTKNRFKKTKYNYTEVVPPPNWYKRFPNGYNETNMPDISKWQEFQNWMFTLAFADFNKLAQRNNIDTLPQGTYEVSVGLHFPVLPFKGKKKIFISQRLALGGKNYFLGYSWIAGGGVCLILGLALLAVNMVKPRKPGDVNLLSWKKQEFAAYEKEEPLPPAQQTHAAESTYST